MRSTCLMLVAIGLIGCGRIDSTGSKPVTDNTAPGTPRATNDTARAPATPTATPTAATEPDNTAVNARDANRTTRNPKLPIDQKETQADIDITAKIRQQVLKTDGLSVNARNAKIITADGQVTLRGPVESDAERDTIARIAREIAGEGNVDNQLEVKTSGKSPTTSTTNP